MNVEDKICKTHGLTSFVLRVDGRFRCRKCASEAVQRRRLLLKVKAVELKGGKCQKCGYNACIAALTFHHRDQDDKDFGLGSRGRTRAWSKIVKELEKCDLLCCRCHTELHHCS